MKRATQKRGERQNLRTCRNSKDLQAVFPHLPFLPEGNVFAGAQCANSNAAKTSI